MNPLTQDLSVFKDLNLTNQPVGVKFLYRKPEGIMQLDKKMAICEMIKEAQEDETPFYISNENEDCFGAVTLGMTEMPPFAEAGEIWYELEIFGEQRANARIYKYLLKVVTFDNYS